MRAAEWMDTHPDKEMCFCDEKIFSVDEHQVFLINNVLLKCFLISFSIQPSCWILIAAAAPSFTRKRTSSKKRFYVLPFFQNPAAQRYLAPSLADARLTIHQSIRHTTKSMGAKQLMVYVALYTTGEYFIHIYEPREKIDHEKHCAVLSKQISWYNELFPEKPPSSPDAPVFTQDNARPHSARGTQDFLRENFGDNFWSPDIWPPYSPGKIFIKTLIATHLVEVTPNIPFCFCLLQSRQVLE